MKLFLLQLLIDFARRRHDNSLRAARRHLTAVLNLLRCRRVANGGRVIFFGLTGRALKTGDIGRAVVVAAVAAAVELFQGFGEGGLRLTVDFD